MQYLFDIAASRPPDFIIGDPARPYLHRWWVIPRNDSFNVYLHRIMRNDDDRAWHDHPWQSTTIVLRGSMVEVTPDGEKYLKAGDVVHREAVAKHRLKVEPFSCWTLFLTGPWERTWGFWPGDGDTFVPWREYVNVENTGQVRE